MRSFAESMTRILSRWLEAIAVPPSYDPLVAESGEIIVVTQSRSWVVQGLLLSFALRRGLHGIRHASMLASDGERSTSPRLWWIFIGEDQLLNQLSESNPQLRYATFSVFESRGPAKNHRNFRMTYAQAAMILARSRYTHYHFGAPIEPRVQVHSARWTLLRLLKLDFYRNFKLVRGIPFLPIRVQEELVLGGVEASEELAILARREGLSSAAIRRKAHRAFHDMAANPLAPLFGFAARSVLFLLRRVFTDLRISGLDSLSSAVKQRTVVLVPMHRSHFDYLIMSALLYEAKLNPPLIAAGINLSFWPFGFLIRSLGGYFVKRDASGDRVNSLVLKRYVTYLIKRGHLQEFFIEGGRSRTGRMRSPKTGLLSVMIDCVIKGIRKDVLFVPVSITYENVVEDKSLADENTGQSKTKENLSSLLKARKIFRRKYGEVMVQLGEPVSLAAACAPIEGAEASGSTRREIVNNFARDLTVRIRRQTNPSLAALAATALMLAPRYSLRRSQLISRVNSLAQLCSLMREAEPAIGGPTPSLERFLNGHLGLVDDLPRSGLVDLLPENGDPRFAIPGNRRYTADFYKNGTFHLFYPAAILSLLNLIGEAPSGRSALAFYRILDREFLFPERGAYQQEIDSVAAKIVGSADSIDRNGPYFIPELLLAPIQSLLWAGHSLSRVWQREGPAAVLDSAPADLVEELRVHFKSAEGLGAILRTEAATYSALASAVETIRSLVDSSDAREPGALPLALQAELTLLERANRAIQEWVLSRSFSS